MSQVSILDTGPLVALLKRRDVHHRWAREVFAEAAPHLVTCDAVVTEACYLLSKTPGGPARVLDFLRRGLVESSFRVSAEAASLERLMSRYENIPMSLADACIVRMSELLTESTVITTDSDFRVYRRNGRHPIPAVMPDAL